MSENNGIKTTRMYLGTKTWNPFKGCRYDCSYCGPSYQQQAKRQMHNCTECYEFRPHQHPERLSKIPNAEIVFVGGNGDISFCDPAFVRQIIAAIVKKNLKRPNQVYYFQTKRPEYLAQFIGEFPPNVILVTTLETNRDDGYGAVSKAPPPSKRYAQFKQLDWPRKVITVEPAMDFDVDEFAEWLISLKPEYVWLGFNSRPRSVSLPEPSKEKMLALAERLKKAGIEVRGKELWGLELNGGDKDVDFDDSSSISSGDDDAILEKDLDIVTISDLEDLHIELEALRKTVWRLIRLGKYIPMISDEVMELNPCQIIQDLMVSISDANETLVDIADELEAIGGQQ